MEVCAAAHCIGGLRFHSMHMLVFRPWQLLRAAAVVAVQRPCQHQESKAKVKVMSWSNIATGLPRPSLVDAALAVH